MQFVHIPAAISRNRGKFIPIFGLLGPFFAAHFDIGRLQLQPLILRVERHYLRLYSLFLKSIQNIFNKKMVYILAKASQLTCLFGLCPLGGPIMEVQCSGLRAGEPAYLRYHLA
jgi:hypothetical protein